MQKKRFLPLLVASLALTGTAVNTNTEVAQAKTHRVSKKHAVKAKKKVTKRKSRKVTKNTRNSQNKGKINLAKYKKLGRFYGTNNDYFIRLSVPEVNASDVYNYNGMMMANPYPRSWQLDYNGTSSFYAWTVQLINHSKETVNAGQFIQKHFKLVPYEYRVDPAKAPIPDLTFSNNYPDKLSQSKNFNYVYKNGEYFNNYNKDLKPGQSMYVAFGFSMSEQQYYYINHAMREEILNNDGAVLYKKNIIPLASGYDLTDYLYKVEP